MSNIIGQFRGRPELKSQASFFVAAGLFLVALFAIIAPPAEAANPPAIISYQGRLLNSSNFPVTTTVAMKFVLYSAATDGTALYTASGTLPTTSTISVTPSNGLFTVNLGDTGTNEIDPTVFQNNQSLFLEVVVGGETLSPRKQIAASPFAYNAKYLDGFAATSTASTSAYIPIANSSGDFSFNNATFNALRDSLGWLQNQGGAARPQLAYNNGGMGSSATPGNSTVTSSDATVFDISTVSSTFKGFDGAIFDGRYVYLAPYTNGSVFGSVVRYDTGKAFSTASSWAGYDTTAVTSTSKGYVGGVFDGRYVYFAPYNNGTTNHGLVLRYDTTATFATSGSWTAFNTTANVHGNSHGFIGAVFDGRYIYFIPYAHGQVTRYDTTGSFTAAGSWSVFDIVANVNSSANGFWGAVFDGRYVYYVPYGATTRHGRVVRYDTTATFSAAGSWSQFNIAGIDSGAAGYEGATFDGRYIYFAPYHNGTTQFGKVARYDTAVTFSATTSWSLYDVAANVDSNAVGFDGALFDGRYVYLVPFQDASATHGRLTRYDTTGAFNAAASWNVYDLTQVDSNAKGFEGGVFDGRHIYLVPGIVGARSQVTRIRAYSGGVDTSHSAAKLARGSELFLDSSGQVGIGTTTPSSKLTIIGATNTVQALVQGASNQTSANVFEVRNATNTLLASIGSTGAAYFRGSSLFGTSTAPSTPYKVFIDAGASTNPGLAVNGYVQASGFITGTTTLDLAELYPVSSSCLETGNCPTAGDAACVIEGQSAAIEKCATPYNEKAIGIVSTNPGFTLGGFGDEASRKVALAGRVPLKVSAAGGSITAGDRLTTSDIPGVAQKATKAGPTIGIALESYPNPLSPEGGLMLVLVNVSWWDGAAKAASLEQPATAAAATAESTSPGLWAQFLEYLKEWGVLVEKGLVRAQEFVAERIQTNLLCLGKTCVNEQQLKDILDKTNTAPPPEVANLGAAAAPVESAGASVAPSAITEPATSTTTLEPATVSSAAVPEATTAVATPQSTESANQVVTAAEPTQATPESQPAAEVSSPAIAEQEPTAEQPSEPAAVASSPGPVEAVASVPPSPPISVISASPAPQTMPAPPASSEAAPPSTP